MRKIIILVIVLLVCGCSKKLNCTYESDYEDVRISNNIMFDFNSNTYEQKDIMIFNNSESAKEYFKDVEEFIDEYNLVLEKNKIISKLGGEIKLDGSEEEIKKQYETYGYYCK